jgi:hypothetical protein
MADRRQNPFLSLRLHLSIHVLNQFLHRKLQFHHDHCLQEQHLQDNQSLAEFGQKGKIHEEEYYGC